MFCILDFLLYCIFLNCVFPKKHSGYETRYAEIGKCDNGEVSIKTKTISLKAADEGFHDQGKESSKVKKIIWSSEFIG